MKYVIPVKSVKITESAKFSPLQTHIKLFQLEEIQQANICPKLFIKTCITRGDCLQNLFKVNNKDNKAKSNGVIQVSLLLTFSTLNNCFYLEL